MSEPAARDEQHGGDQPPPRPREPVFNMPSVVLALIAVCAIVHLIRSYAFDPVQDLEFLLRFAFIPVRYSGEYLLDAYAFVSPLTYALVHGSLVHLAINMVWLAAFGSPLANRLGAVRFLLFWAVTVLAAVLLHYVLHPLDSAPLVGASGAISGMMGAAARFAFRIDRSTGRPAFAGRVLPISAVIRSRTAVVFLAVWMIVNVVAGLGIGASEGAPRIAWEAHIGGFLAGFFGVFLFDRPRPRPVPPARD